MEDSDNHSMDFESVPASQLTATRTMDSSENELPSFKVKTFENFISESQKQPKADSFIFFHDDMPKSNSFKTKFQNENSSFVDSPKTTSLKESFISSEPLFSSTKIFETPEVIPPSIRMEDTPTTKFQTFNVPRDVSKRFSFKCPTTSLEKLPFINTSSANKSLSFFSQTSKESNGEKASVVQNSFKQPSCAFELKTTIASTPEVRFFIYSKVYFCYT